VREREWVSQIATCETDSLAGGFGAVVSVREPCFSAEGGAGASSTLANADRPSAISATIAFLTSNRADGPRADQCYGDQALASTSTGRGSRSTNSSAGAAGNRTSPSSPTRSRDLWCAEAGSDR
jgi:hypothetical protein